MNEIKINDETYIKKSSLAPKAPVVGERLIDGILTHGFYRSPHEAIAMIREEYLALEQGVFRGSMQDAMVKAKQLAAAIARFVVEFEDGVREVYGEKEKEEQATGRDRRSEECACPEGEKQESEKAEEFPSCQKPVPESDFLKAYKAALVAEADEFFKKKMREHLTPDLSGDSGGRSFDLLDDVEEYTRQRRTLL